MTATEAPQQVAMPARRGKAVARVVAVVLWPIFIAVAGYFCPAAPRHSWQGNDTARLVTFSPDGLVLATSEEEMDPVDPSDAGLSSLRLWDLASGSQRCFLAYACTWTREVASSPGGTLV